MTRNLPSRRRRQWPHANESLAIPDASVGSVDRHLIHVKALSPGGYLVVGTSERVSDPKGLGLTSPYHFIYQKS